MKRLVTEGATIDQASTGTSARDRVRARRLARKRKKTLRIALIVVVACGLLVGAYALGFSYFSTHYFPGTRIAGVDAAGMTEADLSQAIDARLGSFEARVTNGDFDLSLSGSTIDLSGDSSKIAHDHMVCQDVSIWPLSILGAGRASDPVLVFDSNKLAVSISEAVASHNKRAKEPVSATLVLNEDNDSFLVKGERMGTTLDASAVYGAVRDAVARGESQVELTSAALVQPKYKADSREVQSALAHANGVLSYNIGLTHDGKELSCVTAKSFAPWIEVQGDLSLGVNQDAAATWAEQELWYKTDYADDNNVYSVDAQAFAKELSDSIRWEGGKSFDVPYIKTQRYLPGGGKLNTTPWIPEFGRYIDVNKKDQTACLFDSTGRVLFEAYVTTGNEGDGEHATPVGKYAIYDKQRDQTLSGFDEDEDGNADYESFVNYWLPFYKGIGLHDASWRNEFGGEIYKDWGTHGCVSFSVKDMPALYAMAHPGDVVYVHE